MSKILCWRLLCIGMEGLKADGHSVITTGRDYIWMCTDMNFHQGFHACPASPYLHFLLSPRDLCHLFCVSRRPTQFEEVILHRVEHRPYGCDK